MLIRVIRDSDNKHLHFRLDFDRKMEGLKQIYWNAGMEV